MGYNPRMPKHVLTWPSIPVNPYPPQSCGLGAVYDPFALKLVPSAWMPRRGLRSLETVYASEVVGQDHISCLQTSGCGQDHGVYQLRFLFCIFPRPAGGETDQLLLTRDVAVLQ